MLLRLISVGWGVNPMIGSCGGSPNVGGSDGGFARGLAGGINGGLTGCEGPAPPPTTTSLLSSSPVTPSSPSVNGPETKDYSCKFCTR